MLKIDLQFFGKGGSGKKGGGAKKQLANKDAMGFKDFDEADYHELYNGSGYYQQQQFSPETQAALKEYVKADAEPGSLYSKSQILNHAMKEGYTLTKKQQTMKEDIMAGMHNLGYNSTLTRYARLDYMEKLSTVAGIDLSKYYNKSEAEIQKALVGKSFIEKGFISTSYNNFAKAPNDGKPFTDKCVKINYKAPAKTQAVMPPMGKGGNLGEIVLAPDQSYKITGARFTGIKGRSGLKYYDQIEIDIEIV